ncbi:MAG: ABC transporter substrate-binding protein [Nocardioides sp.]|uniref:ABC transporter substrate-binding protein n=1 Tax=Nocardioides sp. TaxID=35761 RepID=UPI0039E27223
MYLSTRFTTAAAMAVATCLTLAACGGSSVGTASSTSSALPTLGTDDKVTITFESYNVAQGGTWADTVDELISGFEAEHPNVTVKAQAPANLTGSNTAYAANLQAEILAGQAPDVAQETFDALDWMATQGVVDPLQDVVGTQAIKEAFNGKDLSTTYPGTWPMNQKARTLADENGKTYGMPYVFSTPVLWYNKTALDKLGITMPAAPTWDDIETIGKKLVAAGHKTPVSIPCTVTGGDWCMQGIIKSAGGHIVSSDKKTIQFGDQGSIDAVTEMRKLYDEGILLNTDVTTMTTAFAKGQSLIQLNTSNALATFTAGAQAGGWDLAATKMPAFSGKTPAPTNSGSALFLVHQDDPDQQKQAAAWEFIKYITGPDGVDAITKGIGYVPIRDTMASAADGPLHKWYTATPGAEVNVAQLQQLQPWDAYPGDNYSQISKLFSDAVQNSVYLGKDPKSTLTQAQSDAQALVK